MGGSVHLCCGIAHFRKVVYMHISNPKCSFIEIVHIFNLRLQKDEITFYLQFCDIKYSLYAVQIALILIKFNVVLV